MDINNELNEFFSLIKQAKQQKKEEIETQEKEYRDLVGDLSLESVLSEFSAHLKGEDKPKKEVQEVKEERQIQEINSWLTPQVESGDVKDIINSIISDNKKPVITENKANDDVIDRALQILEKVTTKEEVQTNTTNPEISKIRRELENLKNIVAAQGGGGEVRLEFLDDVNRNSVKQDRSLVMYDGNSSKFIGTDALPYATVAGIATVAEGLTGTPNIVVGIITASNGEFSGTLDVTGNISCAGTITYNDVTNVDSLGLGTFRSGVVVNTGTATTALIVNGDARITGILTIGTSSLTLNGTDDSIQVGAGLTIRDTGDAVYSGVITATTFNGNLTASALSVTGVSTFLDDINIGVGGDGTNTKFRFRQLYLGTGTRGVNISADTSTVYATRIRGDQAYGWTDDNTTYSNFAAGLFSDGYNIVAQRNGVGAGQTFRVYNTYTSLTDFERANIGWTKNTFIVGTEKGSAGGTARQLELHTDGTARVAITTDGNVGIASTQPTATLDVGGDVTVSGGLIVSGVTTTSNLTVSTNTDGTSDLLTLHADADGVDNGLAGIKLSGNGGDHAAYIYGGHSTAGNSYLSFYTDLWGGSHNPQERVRIDSSGRIGIGTIPEEILHIKGPSETPADRDGVMLQHTTAAATADTGLPIVWSGYGSGALTNYTFASICGRKENGTSGDFSGYLQFATGSSGGSVTEKARLDSSGRLLVGTSTALDTSLIGIYGNSNDAGDAALSLRRRLNASNGEGLGVIKFGDLRSGSNYAEIAAVADGVTGTNDYPGRLVFSTTADGASSPAERMRIRTNTSSIYATGYVEVNSNRTSSALILFKVTSGATAVETGNDRFYIYGDGNVENSTGTYGQISDQKLKENIIDASSQWDDIKNLRVRNFNFRPDTNLPTHQQLGFVAQEVEAVSPGLVNTVPDLDEEGEELGTETKSVKTSIVYMKAVKALQEAMERIETLEAKVDALETQKASFESRLAALENN